MNYLESLTDVKQSLKKKLLFRFFNKKLVSELNGSEFNLQNLVEIYFDEPLNAKVFGSILSDTQKNEAYLKFLELVFNFSDSLQAKRLWKLCPELIGIFYILSKYSLDLWTITILDQYYFFPENRNEAAINYLNSCLQIAINPLVKDKYYSFIASNNSIDMFHITNNKYKYSFHNLDSSISVLNMIRKEEFGEI